MPIILLTELDSLLEMIALFFLMKSISAETHPAKCLEAKAV